MDRIMSELLILFSLLKNKSTIYGIKQKIHKSVGFFLNISLGQIYPALKKLEKNGHVKVKSSMSEGGKKSSIYSITSSGVEYFENLMLEDYPANYYSIQLVNIKVLLLSSLNRENQIIAVTKTIKYIENQKKIIYNSLEVLNDNDSKIQKDTINYHFENMGEYIHWLKTLL